MRKTLFRQQHDNVHILVAKTNSSSFTYDGIEVGGERIADEIEQTVARLTQQGARLTKISLVGYSLGGLIARYAVGLLYRHGVFDTLTPVNFTTFASPHLGVRSQTKGFGGYFWNEVAARALSVSGRQMWCIDHFRDTGRPLLAVMAEPNSIFVRGLKKFKNKSLYANTLNDRSVPYYTARITSVDPFVDQDAVDVHYLEGEDDRVLLDPEHPVSPRTNMQKPGSLYERFQMVPQRTWNNIPFYALLTVMLPIGVTVMLVNSGYQTYKSAKRIQLHEQGKAAVNPRKYRIPMLEETQALQDHTVERLIGTQPEAYLPTPPPESSTTTPASSASTAVPADGLAEAVGRHDPEKGARPFPTLALTDEQFGMIKHLDEVGFVKYPAHIQKVRHTHAAIIVRMSKKSFSEGEVVVSHWARNFEA